MTILHVKENSLREIIVFKLFLIIQTNKAFSLHNFVPPPILTLLRNTI